MKRVLILIAILLLLITWVLAPCFLGVHHCIGGQCHICADLTRSLFGDAALNIPFAVTVILAFIYLSEHIKTKGNATLINMRVRLNN